MASITRRLKAYHSITGLDIIGFTYASLVDQLAEQKFTRPSTRAVYRRGVARRINGSTGRSTVDPSSDKSFIESMVRCGQLQPLE